MALRGDQGQHEQRPRLVVHRHRVLASQRPLGGAVRTWRPTTGPGVYGAGMEQPAAASVALLGDPRQHEQRPRVVVHRYRVLASRRPRGGAVGTWRPTTGPGVHGAGMEQPCGVCFRGGGFGCAAWRPEAARAAAPCAGSLAPGFSEPAAPGVRREDLAAHKRPQRVRHRHGAALWRLFEGRRLRWRCVATRGSTSSSPMCWFLGTGF